MTVTEDAPAVRTSELFIGGRWCAAERGRTARTRSELTGRPVAEVAAASPADARRAVEAAERGLETWAGWPPARRRAVLERAAALFTERADDLAALMREEMGAAWPWREFNVSVAREMLAEAAAQAYSAVGEVIPSDVPGLTALGVRRPAGVVVGIAPWNAPLILGVRALAMPLAYGNTVVLKSSEQAPCTQGAIVEILHDAGAPPGAVNLVSNAPRDAPEVVEALVAHPAVARVNFTGSTRSVADLAVIADPAGVCRLLAGRLPARATAPPAPMPVADPVPPPGPGEPLRPAHVFDLLARLLPADAVVVEETPSSRPELHRRVRARAPMGFLSAAAGGLGFGLPAAAGVKLGAPDRPVVAVLGDGSSLYGIQGLWSAAHYGAGVLYVVLANGAYAIMDRLAERAGPGRAPWPGFAEVRVSAIAEGFGCPARRITSHEELTRALTEVLPSLADRRTPLLLDIDVAADPTYG